MCSATPLAWGGLLNPLRGLLMDVIRYTIFDFAQAMIWVWFMYRPGTTELLGLWTDIGTTRIGHVLFYTGIVGYNWNQNWSGRVIWFSSGSSSLESVVWRYRLMHIKVRLVLSSFTIVCLFCLFRYGCFSCVSPNPNHPLPLHRCCPDVFRVLMLSNLTTKHQIHFVRSYFFKRCSCLDLNIVCLHQGYESQENLGGLSNPCSWSQPPERHLCRSWCPEEHLSNTLVVSPNSLVFVLSGEVFVEMRGPGSRWFLVGVRPRLRREMVSRMLECQNFEDLGGLSNPCSWSQPPERHLCRSWCPEEHLSNTLVVSPNSLVFFLSDKVSLVLRGSGSRCFRVGFRPRPPREMVSRMLECQTVF